MNPNFGTVESIDNLFALAKFSNCMEMKISLSLSFLGKEIRRENIFLLFSNKKDIMLSDMAFLVDDKLSLIGQNN